VASAAALAFTVNGQPTTVEVAGSTALIQVLRHDLGLAGVRTGCAIGECGACTVLVDGAPVRSCITPASEAVGRDVVTPEGLGTPDAPHPIQQAFLARQAAQCGYCVNGMIMTVAGLADDPVDDDTLCRALDEHLCRCGTHLRLLAAARRALGLPDATATDAPAAAPGVAPAAATSAAGDGTEAGELPPAVRDHPRIEQWVAIDSDGRFRVQVGKVELGQGIRAAFCRIAAAHLGVDPGRVAAAPTRTGETPDLAFTAGSMSIEQGGTALARAAAAACRVLRQRAAARLGVAADDLRSTGDGFATGDGSATGDGPATGDGDGAVSFAALAAEGPVTGTITAADVPRWDLAALATPAPRADLPRKLTGAAGYLQDLTLPGMRYARLALPPGPDAELARAGFGAARSLPGVVEVVRDGRLVLVVAERDDQALRAVGRLGRDLVWRDGSAAAPTDLEAHLRSLPSRPHRLRGDDGVEAALAGADRHAASYAVPYQTHGPMAPSVAVAQRDGDDLTVWTHAQGIYPLRRELAALLGLAEERVTVEHVDGPGCYGMNGADDAAAFAAVAATAVPGRPVRLQLSLADEFAWEPHGPAMLADLEAGLDGDGRLVAWRHRVVTDTHTARPHGSGDRLAAAWLREGSAPRPWAGPSEGGARNATPLYDVPLLDVVAEHVRGPVRTSALRCLGAFGNTFAAESFVDELAERAGADPVAFRLAHLTDPRARAVLEVAAARAGWQPHVGPSGRGLGVAVARYKGSKAYVAQVAEVEVDTGDGSFRVRRLVAVADAGAVVDPDGLRNQLEGGTLQGLSRTLHERYTLGPHGVVERDWTTYPVLRFRDVPALDLHVLARPDQPPLGAGEAATPPVPAAVANALDDAVGIRLRRLPLTPAQLQQRLLDMDDTEAARVRL
jgi:nicotinate dehydrogenase subunit B